MVGMSTVMRCIRSMEETELELDDDWALLGLPPCERRVLRPPAL